MDRPETTARDFRYGRTTGPVNTRPPTDTWELQGGVLASLENPSVRSRADVTSIQYENGKRTRTKFLAAVQEGKSLRDAALFAGWMNMQSYYYHRKNYPLWAAEVDLARQGNRPNPKMLVTGLAQGGSYEVIPGIHTVERISSEFSEFVKDNFPDRRGI